MLKKVTYFIGYFIDIFFNLIFLHKYRSTVIMKNIIFLKWEPETQHVSKYARSGALAVRVREVR